MQSALRACLRFPANRLQPASRAMGTFARMDWSDPLDYKSLLTDEEKMVMVSRFGEYQLRIRCTYPQCQKERNVEYMLTIAHFLLHPT